MTKLPPHPPLGEAQALADSPLLAAIFDELERASIEAAINAQPDEHDKRWACACQVNAIRSVRRNLEGMALGKIKRPDDRRG